MFKKKHTKDRQTKDRSNFYTVGKLGKTREVTPEGYLLCRDVAIACTGSLLYGEGEVPVTADAGLIVITRGDDDLFSPQTISSFEGIRAMIKGGITNKKEQAMFLAQMDHESGGFGRLSENLNYSKKGLLKTFGKYYKSDALAAKEAKNPEKIANRVYGGRMGNTNIGDGYKYRGRGFIQITGKSNYEAFSKYSGIDIVSNPDLAARPDVAAQIAVWYWNKRVKSKVPGGVKAVTKAINGGTNGLQDRIEKTEKYSKLVNQSSFMNPETGIKSNSPPSGNPHKSQVSSSNMSASNVTINQTFKTDMTINGAREPIESANAVKRQQENQLAFMARGATNPLAG